MNNVQMGGGQNGDRREGIEDNGDRGETENNGEQAENHGHGHGYITRRGNVVFVHEHETEDNNDKRYLYFDSEAKLNSYRARLVHLNAENLRIGKGVKSRRWGNGRIQREALQWLDVCVLPFIDEFGACNVPPDMREIITEVQQDYDREVTEWPAWTPEQLDVCVLIENYLK